MTTASPATEADFIQAYNAFRLDVAGRAVAAEAAARAALPLGATVWDKAGRRYTVKSVGLNTRAQVVVGVHEHKGFPATFYPADLLTADPRAALSAQPAA